MLILDAKSCKRLEQRYSASPRAREKQGKSVCPDCQSHIAGALWGRAEVVPPGRQRPLRRWHLRQGASSSQGASAAGADDAPVGQVRKDCGAIGSGQRCPVCRGVLTRLITGNTFLSDVEARVC
eukprot:jgi/Mesen1/6436/ME000033S05723